MDEEFADKQEEHSILEEQEEPSISEEKEELSISEEQEEQSISEKKKEPSISEEQEEPSISEEQEEPSILEEQEEPSISKEQEEPSILEEQEVPSILEIQVGPSISEDQEKSIMVTSDMNVKGVIPYKKLATSNTLFGILEGYDSEEDDEIIENNDKPNESNTLSAIVDNSMEIRVVIKTSENKPVAIKGYANSGAQKIFIGSKAAEELNPKILNKKRRRYYLLQGQFKEILE